jgi:hypothetical protein
VSAAVRQPQLPVMEVRCVDAHTANALLTAWEHPLGECNRPFGREDWLLEIDGRSAALATSASIVSSTSPVFGHSWRRDECVELARIVRSPYHPRVMRVMLRLWSEYLAARWPYWQPPLAVSYAMPGTKGDIYRFDGWTRVGVRRPSGGGGTWTRTRPSVNDIADGVKTLWVKSLDPDLSVRKAA